MKRAKIYIDGMTCEHCINRVSRALDSAGVQDYDVKIGEANILFNEDNINMEIIAKALKEAGYTLKRWDYQ